MGQTTYTIRLIDKVTKNAGKIQGSFNRIKNSAEKAGNSINMMGVIAGGVAVAGIFKLGAELEKTQVFFNTLTGSVEKGTKLFEGLTQFANATPFSNAAINKNAQTLLGFGEKAEGIVKTLRILGDVSGGDQNRLQSLTLAFAQATAAGKLMGQDLNQMINAGFNPLQVISEKTGKSLAVLKKEMAAGKISAKLLRSAFEGATEKGGRFHKLTEKMSRTMAGKWSTALGKGQFALSKLGLSMKSIFVPILDSAITAIDKLIVWVDKNQKSIIKWGKRMLTAAKFIGIVIIAIKAWAAATAALNLVMNANPVVAIITTVVALGVAVDSTAKKLGGWTNIFAALNDMSDAVFRSINAGLDIFAAKINNVLSNFKNMGRVLSGEISLNQFASLTKFNEAITKGITDGAGITIAKSTAKIKSILNRTDFTGYINETKKGAAGLTAGLGDTNISAGSVGLSDEAKKLQAEGIVSGGNINTINININSVTGINTLTTTTLAESANEAGRQVLNVINEAIADIKIN